MNLSLDVAEFENMMSLDNPIQSSTATRWERKARQQASSQGSSNSTSQSQADRYIPHRGGMDFDLSNRSLVNNSQMGEDMDVSCCATSEHAKLLLANTLDMSNSSLTDASKPARVLAFKNKAPAPTEGYQSSVRVLYSAQGAKKDTAAVKTMRHIPTAPVRVLDAPDMLDDYCKFTYSFYLFFNVMTVATNDVTCIICRLELAFLGWKQHVGSRVVADRILMECSFW